MSKISDFLYILNWKSRILLKMINFYSKLNRSISELIWLLFIFLTFLLDRQSSANDIPQLSISSCPRHCLFFLISFLDYDWAWVDSFIFSAANTIKLGFSTSLLHLIIFWFHTLIEIQTLKYDLFVDVDGLQNRTVFPSYN
jgi:hypothetical protein